MTARTLNAHGVAMGREAFERQHDSLMVQRFQRSRWSFVRRRVDAMPGGSVRAFARKHRDAVVTAIRRTQSAYGDRRYSTRNAERTSTGCVVVTRTK